MGTRSEIKHYIDIILNDLIKQIEEKNITYNSMDILSNQTKNNEGIFYDMTDEDGFYYESSEKYEIMSKNRNDSINNKSEHSLNDEEKIDDILSEINNYSNKQNKKTKYWTKYIKQQKLESKLSRKMSFCSLSIKNSSTFKKEMPKPGNDLFILGILERAAKEKKQKRLAKSAANNVWS